MADMKTYNCEQVRDLLPDLVSDRLDPIEAAAVRSHVHSCADCHAELEIAELIAQSRVPVPAGLEARVLTAAGSRRTTGWSNLRYAVAASIAVAVIGGSVVLAPLMTSSNAPPAAVVESPLPETGGPGWFGVQDAFVTGASSLGDLSLEELEKLLLEIGS
jgi:hypothetical protein